MNTNEMQIFNFDLQSLEEAEQQIQSFLDNPEYENKDINYSISYIKNGNRYEHDQSIWLKIAIEV
jgi:hypothetical protein